MKDTYEEIEECLKEYFKIIYFKELDKLPEILYQDDLIEYKNKIDTLAKEMEYFGENRGLLRFFKLKSITELYKMTPNEFIKHVIHHTMNYISEDEKEIKKIYESITIHDIQHAEFLTTVSYSFEMQAFDEITLVETEIEMIKSDGKWKALFKNGFGDALKEFHQQINDFHQRKAKDKPELIKKDDWLEKVELVGWKNIDGKIVIEPRFKEAGNFSGNFAPVKAMTYWGYINKQGEFAIQPQFSKAREFHEHLAAVQIETDEELDWSFRKYWTFINEEGEVITDLQFDEVNDFTEEGLAAVCKNDKWGYLNTKGEMKIDFNFVHAESFNYERTNVTVRKKNGEYAYLIINTKGEVIE